MEGVAMKVVVTVVNVVVVKRVSERSGMPIVQE